MRGKHAGFSVRTSNDTQRNIPVVRCALKRSWVFVPIAAIALFVLSKRSRLTPGQPINVNSKALTSFALDQFKGTYADLPAESVIAVPLVQRSLLERVARSR